MAATLTGAILRADRAYGTGDVLYETRPDLVSDQVIQAIAEMLQPGAHSWRLAEAFRSFRGGPAITDDYFFLGDRTVLDQYCAEPVWVDRGKLPGSNAQYLMLYECVKTPDLASTGSPSYPDIPDFAYAPAASDTSRSYLKWSGPVISISNWKRLLSQEFDDRTNPDWWSVFLGKLTSSSAVDDEARSLMERCIEAIGNQMDDRSSQRDASINTYRINEEQYRTERDAQIEVATSGSPEDLIARDRYKSRVQMSTKNLVSGESPFVFALSYPLKFFVSVQRGQDKSYAEQIRDLLEGDRIWFEDIGFTAWKNLSGEMDSYLMSLWPAGREYWSTGSAFPDLVDVASWNPDWRARNKSLYDAALQGSRLADWCRRARAPVVASLNLGGGDPIDDPNCVVRFSDLSSEDKPWCLAPTIGWDEADWVPIAMGVIPELMLTALVPPWSSTALRAALEDLNAMDTLWLSTTPVDLSLSSRLRRTYSDGTAGMGPAHVYNDILDLAHVNDPGSDVMPPFYGPGRHHTRIAMWDPSAASQEGRFSVSEVETGKMFFDYGSFDQMNTIESIDADVIYHCYGASDDMSDYEHLVELGQFTWRQQYSGTDKAFTFDWEPHATDYYGDTDSLGRDLWVYYNRDISGEIMSGAHDFPDPDGGGDDLSLTTIGPIIVRRTFDEEAEEGRRIVICTIYFIPTIKGSEWHRYSVQRHTFTCISPTPGSDIYKSLDRIVAGNGGQIVSDEEVAEVVANSLYVWTLQNAAQDYTRDYTSREALIYEMTDRQSSLMSEAQTLLCELMKGFGYYFTSDISGQAQSYNSGNCDEYADYQYTLVSAFEHRYDKTDADARRSVIDQEGGENTEAYDYFDEGLRRVVAAVAEARELDSSMEDLEALKDQAQDAYDSARAENDRLNKPAAFGSAYMRFESDISIPGADLTWVGARTSGEKPVTYCDIVGFRNMIIHYKPRTKIEDDDLVPGKAVSTS